MILVAGGTGRLGTVVVGHLVDNGTELRVLTRDPARAAHLGSEVQIVTGDVRDPATLGSAVRGAGIVVSAVHGFVGPGRVTPASVDHRGNANLVDAAAAVGADLVLVSMVAASADSPLELARMKFAAEQYAARRGVPTTIVRATAFLELWVEILRHTAGRSGRPLVFGRGDNPINFVSVHDVAALVERVIADPSTRNQTYEIGGPDNLTFNQLARAIGVASGRATSARHVPPMMLRLMANTLGRVRPQLGRQARSALAMDAMNLAFEQPDAGFKRTSVADVLAANSRS